MIKKRPTFATGHSLAGLPRITTALYTDEQVELYSLECPADKQSVLILCMGRSRDEMDRWWSAQRSATLSVDRVLGVNESPPGTVAAMLGVSGDYLNGATLRDSSDQELRALFNAILDAVDRGRAVQMFPDFSSPFLWVASDRRSVISILPSLDRVKDDAEQVREVAAAFSKIAIGIIPPLKPEAVLRLRSWARFASEELERIVKRSLQPSTSKAPILTISELRKALGGEPNSEPAAISTLPSSAERGLGKVAGMHLLKALLLEEVVEPVRNPGPYRRYGLLIPNGILLFGPPGCGKTYIARQLAEELGHYFVEVIPSELASPFIHQSVIRIRELFDLAAENAPSIVFIDEFEALVPSREDLGGHQQYKSEEVNEFLAHLNKCAERGIFVIAATNQPQKIDAAVRRTGRLDKLIYVGPPDQEARREMLSFYLRNRPTAPDLSPDVLAETLVGYSASDLQFLVDEAARDAMKMRAPISTESFVSAMERIHGSVPADVEAQYQTMEQRGL